ncbi:MAG: hypothetical protein JJT82_07430 [Legionellaceae bacterium]|nr:hypothetical protein [Legionellaceae bacterium]
MIIIKYQLVIQFPEELFEEIDEIADLEDRLDESLFDAEVDGHDIGSGEINLFIHTHHAVTTYEIVKNILEAESINLKYVNIAYREIGSKPYIALWPKNLEILSVS